MKQTVLVIDNDDAICEAIILLLADESCHVVHTDTGLAGFDMARSCLPDLILIDAVLPDIDGYEVCHRIRLVPELASVPVIMMARCVDLLSEKHRLAGVGSFITKPFSLDDLSLRISLMLRMNRYRLAGEQGKLFEWIVNHLEEGYLIIAANGCVTAANETAEKLLGQHASQLRQDGTSFIAWTKAYAQWFPKDEWRCWPNLISDCFLVIVDNTRQENSWVKIEVLLPSALKMDQIIVRLTAAISQAGGQASCTPALAHTY